MDNSPCDSPCAHNVLHEFSGKAWPAKSEPVVSGELPGVLCKPDLLEIALKKFSNFVDGIPGLHSSQLSPCIFHFKKIEKVQEYFVYAYYYTAVGQLFDQNYRVENDTWEQRAAECNFDGNRYYQ